LDKAQAVQLYWQAADQGHADAQYRLNILYEEGEGVPQGVPQAAQLYRRAAAQDHADAPYRLDRLSSKGY
jgi:TPR repeat protein